MAIIKFDLDKPIKFYASNNYLYVSFIKNCNLSDILDGMNNIERIELALSNPEHIEFVDKEWVLGYDR